MPRNQWRFVADRRGVSPVVGTVVMVGVVVVVAAVVAALVFGLVEGRIGIIEQALERLGL